MTYKTPTTGSILDPMPDTRLFKSTTPVSDDMWDKLDDEDYECASHQTSEDNSHPSPENF